MGNGISDELQDWEELKGINWPAILLGNGFSINIWSRFDYNSLYELSSSDFPEFPLSKKAIKLFEEKDTTNFEEILNLLSGAMLADSVLECGQQKILSSFYKGVRKSLAGAVQYAHIPPSIINTKYISDELLNYKTIFTTNYDLIPYWAIMDYNTSNFRDYFWNGDCSFDLSNTEIYGDCTRILYLHGALHLLETVDMRAFKSKADGVNLLDKFPKSFTDDYSPLFITEGDYKKKMAHIASSDYLKFAHKELEMHNNNLVIIGHDLSVKYDKHLITSIKSWKDRSIAISVFNELPPDEIISFKARMKKYFPSHTIHFFDSRTHPLCSETLKVA